MMYLMSWRKNLGFRLPINGVKIIVKIGISKGWSLFFCVKTPENMDKIKKKYTIYMRDKTYGKCEIIRADFNQAVMKYDKE